MLSHHTKVLLELPRATKRKLIIIGDLSALSFALWLAYALKFDTWLPAHMTTNWPLLAAVPCLSIGLLYYFGLYRTVNRYLGMDTVLAILKGVGASMLVAGALLAIGGKGITSTSVLLIYATVALLFLCAVRLLVRFVLGADHKHIKGGTPVIIYGVGSAGVQLLGTLLKDPHYYPVAFVDDDNAFHGRQVLGKPVHPPSALPDLIQKFGITHILLALPSVARSRIQTLLSTLEPLQVHIKTLPSISDLVSGVARIDDLREVQIEDLLGRDPVAADPQMLAACISDKVVMVTGAGGSIGSELVRQIARIGPRKLVLFEVSEVALYQIESELKLLHPKLECVSILGSVCNYELLKKIYTDLHVQTIYHAAAYKHVPLVEYNMLGGIRNNVIGTWRVLEAAVAARVETVVMVSTDKAVRPTNIMGASKRVAELILQSIEDRERTAGRTFPVISIVRFGNVLGSSGSVVPLFRKQLRKGGPITVTHAKVVRYFMTASEAAELVIQAGAMASGGEVFVLDMGEPIRILDLAKRMIRLAGLQIRDEEHPDGDIAITFTGLRPGEKLYEELLAGDGVSGTSHNKIWQAREKYINWAQLSQMLTSLETACGEFDCETASQVLREMVEDYTPASQIYDNLWRSKVQLPGQKVIQHPAANKS